MENATGDLAGMQRAIETSEFDAVVVEGEDMFEGAVYHPSLTLRSRQHVWEQSMKPTLGVSLFGMDATEPGTAAWIVL